jgi:hypothetical protein
MDIFAVIVLIATALFILFVVTAMIKNQVTYRNYSIIQKAIFDYRMDGINKAYENGTIMSGVKHEVEYDDMLDYDSAFKRIFDWGYENILPNDKFEIIKPYIHK